MKVRDLILYTLMFLLCVGFTTDVVEYQLTGNHIYSKSNVVTSRISSQIACTNQPIKSRPATSDPQLKVISEYEHACRSSFIDDMMLFTNMPISVADAQQAADKMAIRLKDFQQQDITPIVIVEPDSEWGLIDFQEYARGDYDAWIAAYFQELAYDGISEQNLGIWIPFPEPQQPYWNNNSNPDDFAHSVNRYFHSLRTVFPEGKTAILLDSQVNADEKAPQLLAYTRLIDNSLVTMAGLQGFPWHPTDEGDTRLPITSASQFAPASLLEEVAHSLGTKEVLLNIGSYRHRKGQNGGDTAVTTEERAATMDSIAREVKILQKDNYHTTVNVFAQDKLNAKEGVDWSYWQPGAYKTSAHTALFTKFIHDIKNENTKISLFDARD